MRAAGNVRAPDKLLCLQWVKKAWEFVATEVINSFKVCGIPVETDGTEDGPVHCILLGGTAADTTAEILADTTTLIAGKQYWLILYVNTACMHRRTVRSAESMRGQAYSRHYVHIVAVLAGCRKLCLALI